MGLELECIGGQTPLEEDEKDGLLIPTVTTRGELDDGRNWIEHETYPEVEIAVRLKHRLVAIHCFTNGNGGHSRLMADVLIQKILRQPVFTWGSVSVFQPGDARTAYLKALQDADRGNIAPLIVFERS